MVDETKFGVRPPMPRKTEAAKGHDSIDLPPGFYWEPVEEPNQPDSNERQVAQTLDGIRRDHVARYEWAASLLEPGEIVLDIGCGVGYGSSILASKAAGVTGLDKDPAAIRYAERHYKPINVSYKQRDFNTWPAAFGGFSTAVCFEVLEHIEDPITLLSDLNANRLIASVPNELVFPWFEGLAFHHRHYTPEQFEAMLNAAGWEVEDFWGQEGTESDVEPWTQGRTLCVVCVRSDKPFGGKWKRLPEPTYRVVTPYRHPTGQLPQSVHLVGLGPSKYALTEYMLQHDYEPEWDELWTINKGIDFLPLADVAWIMDDVYDYAAKHPAYGKGMRRFGGKIIGQTTLPNDGSIPFTEYPLADVLEFWGGSASNWLHSISVGYILAYVGYLGVRRLFLTGIDCSWPNRPDLSEAGNAVVCYWIGRLESIGVEVIISGESALNQTNLRGRYETRKYYGYLRQPA